MQYSFYLRVCRSNEGQFSFCLWPCNIKETQFSSCLRAYSSTVGKFSVFSSDDGNKKEHFPFCLWVWDAVSVLCYVALRQFSLFARCDINVSFFSFCETVTLETQFSFRLWAYCIKMTSFQAFHERFIFSINFYIS